MQSHLNWIIPIVSYKKKIDIDDSKQETDIINEDMTLEASKIIDMKNIYKKKGSNDQSVTYDSIQNKEQELFRPFVEPLTSQEVLTNKLVQENFDAVVNNLNDFYSTVYTNSGLKKQRFVIQRYNLGSKIKETILANGKNIYSSTKYTE